LCKLGVEVKDKIPFAENQVICKTLYMDTKIIIYESYLEHLPQIGILWRGKEPQSDSYMKMALSKFVQDNFFGARLHITKKGRVATKNLGTKFFELKKSDFGDFFVEWVQK